MPGTRYYGVGLPANYRVASRTNYNPTKTRAVTSRYYHDVLSRERPRNGTDSGNAARFNARSQRTSNRSCQMYFEYFAPPSLLTLSLFLSRLAFRFDLDTFTYRYALEARARYVTRKKSTNEETNAGRVRSTWCLTPTLNSISYLKARGWRFSGSRIYNEKSRCRGRKRSGRISPRPEARLQLFIAFPFRFPANKGKGREGGKLEIERGWKLRAAARLFEEVGERRENLSRSLLAARKKRCLK